MSCIKWHTASLLLSLSIEISSLDSTVSGSETTLVDSVFTASLCSSVEAIVGKDCGVQV